LSTKIEHAAAAVVSPVLARALEELARAQAYELLSSPRGQTLSLALLDALTAGDGEMTGDHAMAVLVAADNPRG
jgi:hypothetical protein